VLLECCWDAVNIFYIFVGTCCCRLVPQSVTKGYLRLENHLELKD
jgi:hypothetical protein